MNDRPDRTKKAVTEYQDVGKLDATLRDIVAEQKKAALRKKTPPKKDVAAKQQWMKAPDKILDTAQPRNELERKTLEIQAKKRQGQVEKEAQFQEK